MYVYRDDIYIVTNCIDYVNMHIYIYIYLYMYVWIYVQIQTDTYMCIYIYNLVLYYIIYCIFYCIIWYYCILYYTYIYIYIFEFIIYIYTLCLYYIFSIYIYIIFALYYLMVNYAYFQRVSTKEILSGDEDSLCRVPGGFGACGGPNDGWRQHLHMVTRAFLSAQVGWGNAPQLRKKLEDISFSMQGMPESKCTMSMSIRADAWALHELGTSTCLSTAWVYIYICFLVCFVLFCIVDIYNIYIYIHIYICFFLFWSFIHTVFIHIYIYISMDISNRVAYVGDTIYYIYARAVLRHNMLIWQSWLHRGYITKQSLAAWHFAGSVELLEESLTRVRGRMKEICDLEAVPAMDAIGFLPEDAEVDVEQLPALVAHMFIKSGLYCLDWGPFYIYICVIVLWTYLYIYNSSMNTYIYIYLYIYIHNGSMNTHTYIYIYICIYTNIWIHILDTNYVFQMMIRHKRFSWVVVDVTYLHIYIYIDIIHI